MSILLLIVGGLLLFYLLAPIPSIVDTYVRWGQLHCGYTTTWQKELRHLLQHWQIQLPWRHKHGDQWGDWGIWYRVTFRWWYARIYCWWYPPICNFCNTKALGVYAHGRMPISFAVCAEHAELLSASVEVVREALKNKKKLVPRC